MSKAKKHKEILIEKAKLLGFSSIGISKAGFLQEEAPRLESWLKNSYNGKMSYMENHFDMRLDPTILVPGAKSVVSLTFNYYSNSRRTFEDAPKISKYAFGKDYHIVLKDKLKELLNHLRTEIGEINGRVFTDSAPILERAWAKKSGIGWIGKNANLITYKKGSFQFLCEMILDLELEEDYPTTDHCGSCTKCIDSCPTHAIVSPMNIDARRCISYLTIELKDNNIPVEFKSNMQGWAFGCDICQDVCPWNKFSVAHSEDNFKNKSGFLSFDLKQWEDISEEVFSEIFKNSPIKRSKYQGLKRNLNFIKKAD